ncbi:hypothetical protein NDU88_001923 [Pleurodeles waltl]|uniref:Uncharacterized protein n=1 Tax=Pleurodeles waltl TaxID=8319 RepID=A0AAV7WMB8_PLEWA|nr:hypothetical protein NDU88_001923 [Pleurodeles waltl]
MRWGLKGRANLCKLSSRVPRLKRRFCAASGRPSTGGKSTRQPGLREEVSTSETPCVCQGSRVLGIVVPELGGSRVGWLLWQSEARARAPSNNCSDRSERKHCT